jgi:ribosomal protein L7/L12
MGKYRFIVDVDTDEADRLTDTENLRIAIADGADSQLTVTRVRIDGREFDAEHGTLEATPINADIAQLIAEGRTIQAIKMLRDLDLNLSLMEAKTLVDNWRAKR